MVYGTLFDESYYLNNGEFDHTRAFKLGNKKVVAKHDSREVQWPGKRKNITCFWELETGHLVGMNESWAGVGVGLK